MSSVFSKLYDLLDRRERRLAWLLFALFVLSGLADLVGAASILPFLAAVADPKTTSNQPMLAALRDMVGLDQGNAFLIFLGGVVLVIMFATMVIRLLALWAMAKFAYGQNYRISSRLLSAYLHQPYVWFLNRNAADLGRVVLNETELVVMQALLPALRLVSNAVTILCLIALLVAVNPTVALSTSLVLGGAYAGISLLVRKKIARSASERANSNQLRYRLAQEALTGMKDLKVLGAEDSYISRFSAAARRFTDAGSTATTVGEAPRHLLETLAFGGMVVLVLALLVTGSGSLSEILPTLGVFAFAGMRIFPALQQIYLSLTYIRTVRPMLDNLHRDVRETLGNPVPPTDPVAGRVRLALTRELRLENVHYAYPEANRAALQGIDLVVAARSTVGLVGGSGAGKTTAVDVILGLLAPQSGTLLVDGAPVTPQSIRQWQNNIGYVPQEIFLIDGTIAENIALGMSGDDIDLNAVERAARTAHLHDFVMAELPLGYATPIGDRGLRLSGGQRQRIGIARALFHDPDVLVLDEATSALDNITEQGFIEAVHALGGQKTVIMIAHRLTTVQNCDRIFLMEQGRIAASGTYDTLIAESAAFRHMARA